jgi:hypothetical protein
MDQVRGMLFLGTPHRGSDLASTLDNILSAFSLNKGHYVKELDRMALSLRDINQQFPSVCGGLRLASLYETKETPLATALVKKMVNPITTVLLSDSILMLVASDCQQQLSRPWIPPGIPSPPQR